jgi:hypothetical protein
MACSGSAAVLWSPVLRSVVIGNSPVHGQERRCRPLPYLIAIGPDELQEERGGNEGLATIARHMPNCANLAMSSGKRYTGGGIFWRPAI